MVRSLTPQFSEGSKLEEENSFRGFGEYMGGKWIFPSPFEVSPLQFGFIDNNFLTF